MVKSRAFTMAVDTLRIIVGLVQIVCAIGTLSVIAWFAIMEWKDKR